MEGYGFADRMRGLNENVIREIFKLTQMPDIISFAGGLPSPDSFPGEEIREICGRVLGEGHEAVLQYGTTEGYYPLREWISTWVKRYGINTTAGNILIISGASQGIELAAKAFINPGDYVAVENPTFLSAIQTFRGFQANLMPLAID